MDPRFRGDDKKKIEERQIDFVLDFCFKRRWIPAFAGMTKRR